MDFRERSGNLLLDNAEDESSQYWSPYGSDPADNGHQQNVHTGVKPEHSPGMNKSCIAGKDASGDTGQGSGQSMCSQLIGVGIDAQVCCCIFILANRVE